MEVEEKYGRSIFVEVKVVSESLVSKFVERLVKKEKLADFVDGFAKVEVFVEKKVGANAEDAKSNFLASLRQIFCILLLAANAACFLFESELICCNVLPSISSSLVKLSPSEE